MTPNTLVSYCTRGSHIYNNAHLADCVSYEREHSLVILYILNVYISSPIKFCIAFKGS
jgi:hypothetical protein